MVLLVLMIVGMHGHLVPEIVPSWKIPASIFASPQLYREAEADYLANRASIDQVFTYTFTGPGGGSVPSDVRAAVRFAGKLFSHLLDVNDMTDRDIRVDVSYRDLRCSGSGCELGSASPSGFCSGAGMTLPAALHRLVNGVGCTATSDIKVNLNRRVAFYTGLDGKPPANQFDLVTVVLHELMHGLGFASKIPCGELLCDDYSAFSSFSTPFDRTFFIGDTAFDPQGRSSSELRSFSRSNNVFIGNAHINSNGQPRAKIHAPTTFEPGSSLSHLDNIYSDTTNGLMTKSLVNGRAIHTIGGIAFQQMKAMGYPMKTCQGAYSDCNNCTANYCQWCVYDNTCGDGRLQPYEGSCSITPGFISDSMYCDGSGSTVASATSTTAATTASSTGGLPFDECALDLLNVFCGAPSLEWLPSALF